MMLFPSIRSARLSPSPANVASRAAYRMPGPASCARCLLRFGTLTGQCKRRCCIRGEAARHDACQTRAPRLPPAFDCPVLLRISGVSVLNPELLHNIRPQNVPDPPNYRMSGRIRPFLPAMGIHPTVRPGLADGSEPIFPIDPHFDSSKINSDGNWLIVFPRDRPHPRLKQPKPRYSPKTGRAVARPAQGPRLTVRQSAAPWKLLARCSAV
jgi:hypothetical protein